MRARINIFSCLLTLAFGWVSAQVHAGEDELQWLESPRDGKALAWAREATQKTREQLGALPSRAAIANELKAALAQAPAEPSLYPQGKRIMRYLRDAGHPYGLLQTAPRGDGKASRWTTVLDIAELRKKEGVPFELNTYQLGSGCLAPAYERCLLGLSHGGGDEVEIREFDIAKGEFVAGGFRIGKSRGFAEWLGPDQLLVAHTVGDEPKTSAGWPAQVRIWTRGQALDTAKVVFRGESSDALVQIGTVGTGAAIQGVVTRAIDYSTFEGWLIDAAGNRHLLPFPRDVKPFGVSGATARHAIVQLAKDAVIEGKSYKAESVLAYDADARTPEGERVSVVFAPGKDEFVSAGFGGVAAMRDEVVLLVNRHLRQRAVAVKFVDGKWIPREVLQAAAGQTITARSGGRDSNEFIASIAGFLTPRSQYLIRENGTRQLLTQDPILMKATGFVTEIGSAASKDGTSIDYFLLRPSQRKAGPQPLLMTGYGAFGISVRPSYFDSGIGGPALKVWLERGGAVAIPAIRGGGERGAAWHEAAIREKRQNSYDDFIAVTEHLFKSGFTTPEHIGIFGLSNGGLLTATLGTERPDLFSAVVSDVPLTDLIRMRYMGMGAAWMDEYGNPDDPAQAKAILAYSPYQNVRKGTKYPPFLVTISTEDNRVGPGHARKFAYRLQQAGATTYFYEDEEGGHGVSDAFRNPELMTLRMSFLIDNLMKMSK